MSQTNSTPAILPDLPTASIDKGLWFVFRDGPNLIRAWGATWVGIEKVYFNNHLIQQYDHLKKQEQYCFSIEGQEYRIQCRANPNIKWQVECLLWRNGSVLESLQCRRRKLVGLRPTHAHLYLCIILGIAAGLFNMPATFGIVFVGASIILTLLTTVKTKNFTFEQTTFNNSSLN